MPEISVIIPIYNVEKYLRKCLDSVCGQTFEDLEIICVNDNSADKSLEILMEYEKKDSRIKVLNNEVNMTVGISRNIGLKNSSGKYIYFMDADDYIDEDYLQQLYDNAAKYNADITMNVNILTETSGKTAKYIHPSMPAVPDKGCYIDKSVAIDRSFCVVWMRLFRRQLLEANNIFFECIEAGGDVIYNYIVNIFADSIYAFEGSAYHYLIREDSLAGNAEKNNRRDYNTMKAYDIIYDYLAEHDLLQYNQAKIFNVAPFFKVDTKEKFDLYKRYFNKVRGYLDENRDKYNAIDMFFSQIILESESFDDYKSKYPQSVAMAFLKKGRK